MFLTLFITFVWWFCGPQILYSYYPWLGDNYEADYDFVMSNPWKIVLAIGPISLVFFVVSIIMAVLKKL